MMRKTPIVLAFLFLIPVCVFGAAQQDTLVTIYDIQQGRIPVETAVTVDSIIVTAIDLKPTTYGFNAQERAGGAYSGILCYMGKERPDTVGGVGLDIGDLVRVSGTYEEYNDHSEIQVTSVEILQKGYGEPDPLLMTIEDLGREPEDSTFAEKWEGVFIYVDTVVVTAYLPYDEWLVVEAHTHPGTGQGDSLVIDDKLVSPTLPRPEIGDTLAMIRGVYAFEWGTYRLWPRNDSDVVYIGELPGPNLILAYATSNTSINALFDRDLDETSAEDVSNYALYSGTAILSATLDSGDSKLVHLTTETQPVTEIDSLIACDIRSTYGAPMSECQTYGFRAGITPISFVQTPLDSTTDASQAEGSQVTITGIVTGPSSSFGGTYFVEEKDGGPWSGIYVYDPSANFNVGDSVVVSGFVNEYYGMTEIISVDYAVRFKTGVAINGPDVVTPDMVKTGSPTAEAYEGVLIRVDSVEVFTIRNAYGEWYVGTDGDSLLVGDYAPYTYQPGVGSILNVTGLLRYSYGDFKIEPRDDADIEVISPCTAGVRPKDSALALYGNCPNPFTSTTTIRFSLPEASEVRLTIFDTSGRVIRVVHEGSLSAGEHRIVWDGRDSNGKTVSPGIYFVRLTVGSRNLQTKIVHLR